MSSKGKETEPYEYKRFKWSGKLNESEGKSKASGNGTKNENFTSKVLEIVEVTSEASDSELEGGEIEEKTVNVDCHLATIRLASLNVNNDKLVQNNLTGPLLRGNLSFKSENGYGTGIGFTIFDTGAPCL